jgi:hypothetical protein
MLFSLPALERSNRCAIDRTEGAVLREGALVSLLALEADVTLSGDVRAHRPREVGGRPADRQEARMPESGWTDDVDAANV